VTNYLAAFVSTALCATACPAASPAAVQPAGAGTARYTQAANTGSLTFSFSQAGAANSGAFKSFATELNYDAQNLAAGSLRVTVQIGSLATQDQERDDTLKSADLFDAGNYPTAQYTANSLAKTAGGGIEAVGKLTLRGVTRDLRLPLTIRPAANGVELSGEVTLKRLDFGVGQADWKSTEAVGDAVKVQYRVPLVRAN
jgi:polyisoprenoid-binding protein YceI